MKSVVVDSGFLIGLFDETDPLHARCRGFLRDYRGRFLTTEHIARFTLKKAGPVYKGATTTPLAECNFKDVPGVMTVRLEVTKGEWINDKWRATRVVPPRRAAT